MNIIEDLEEILRQDGFKVTKENAAKGANFLSEKLGMVKDGEMLVGDNYHKSQSRELTKKQVKDIVLKLWANEDVEKDIISNILAKKDMLTSTYLMTFILLARDLSKTGKLVYDE